MLQKQFLKAVTHTFSSFIYFFFLSQWGKLFFIVFCLTCKAEKIEITMCARDYKGVTSC